jgi:hypothetical protein
MKKNEILFNLIKDTLIGISALAAFLLLVYLFDLGPKARKLSTSNCYTISELIYEIDNSEGTYYTYYYNVNNKKYSCSKAIKYPNQIIGRRFKVHYACDESEISEILLNEPCDTLTPPE